MKFRQISLLLAVTVMAVLLSACSMRESVARIEAAEEALEQRVDHLEERLEAALESETVHPAKKPERKPAAEPTLTAEEAEEVALTHAELTRDQVKWIRSDMDRDDGQIHYDVEFFCDGWDYDYEIHGDSGRLLSFEKEKEDGF